MIEVVILVLVALDVLLTHFQFFLARKKDCLDMSFEKNWLPRLIMGSNPNPTNYFIGSFINLCLVTLFIRLTAFYHSTVYQLTIGTILGLFVAVNYMHLINIEEDGTQWNNAGYWKAIKQVQETKTK